MSLCQFVAGLAVLWSLIGFMDGGFVCNMVVDNVLQLTQI